MSFRKTFAFIFQETLFSFSFLKGGEGTYFRVQSSICRRQVCTVYWRGVCVWERERENGEEGITEATFLCLSKILRLWKGSLWDGKEIWPKRQLWRPWQKILRRGGKNTQKNCTKKIFTDNHNGVITHLEPDILECEVKWALGSITRNKASGDDGIPVELFQILKDDAVKVLHSICKQIWKIQQWPQDWKRSFSFQSQRKAMPKNAQITTQLHSSHTLVKWSLKFSKPGFSNTWTMNF